MNHLDFTKCFVMASDMHWSEIVNKFDIKQAWKIYCIIINCNKNATNSIKIMFNILSVCITIGFFSDQQHAKPFFCSWKRNCP